MRFYSQAHALRRQGIGELAVVVIVVFWLDIVVSFDVIVLLFSNLNYFGTDRKKSCFGLPFRRLLNHAIP